jgi:RimJ/RimL family protein N-acetyltransferase
MNSLTLFQEAQILLMDHAFNKMNINRITAAANDKRLLKINEKLFGFKLEGIQRERDYIDGKYCDRHMLGILKSEWITFNENRSG